MTAETPPDPRTVTLAIYALAERVALSGEAQVAAEAPQIKACAERVANLEGAERVAGYASAMANVEAAIKALKSVLEEVQPASEVVEKIRDFLNVVDKCLVQATAGSI